MCKRYDVASIGLLSSREVHWQAMSAKATTFLLKFLPTFIYHFLLEFILLPKTVNEPRQLASTHAYVLSRWISISCYVELIHREMRLLCWALRFLSCSPLGPTLQEIIREKRTGTCFVGKQLSFNINTVSNSRSPAPPKLEN
jgi:hypothetical protein